MDLQLFQRIIQDRCILDPVKPVVIGVSGGPDSLCLLDLMRKTGIPVIVGHLNHGLRLAAIKEEEKVRKICEDWQIPCFVQSVDIKNKAKEHHHTVEEEGRNARYRYLFELAGENKCQAVLVAHNSDDQVETILMHLLRGTGLTGLRGMDYRQIPNMWSETIPLVRPLLGTSKIEVLNYCQENGLTPSFDESNQENTFYRNRLRLELVPYLETFNPNIKEQLFRMAEIIREEDDHLQHETEHAIGKCLEKSGENFFVVNKMALFNLHTSLKRRVVYSLMKRLAPENPNITFETVLSAVDYLEHPTSTRKLSLSAGLEISGYRKQSILLSIEKASLDELWPQLGLRRIFLGDLKSSIGLNNGWRFEFLDTEEISKDDPWKASLDADKCDNLYLDCWLAGDRFRPLGMGDKSIKVSDYWTNTGLPAKARPHWPLVRNNDEIAWIPGFTVSEKYKVCKETRKILVLKIYQTR